MSKNKIKLIVYLFISILIITLFSESSFLYKLNPWSDLNIYLTIGRNILNGGKLYTDLFDHKGPLLYFIYAIVSLISSHSYIGVYLLEIICLYLFMYYSDKLLCLFSNKNHFLLLSIISVLITTCTAFSYGGGSVEELFLPIFQITNYICLNRIVHNSSFTYKDCILIGIFACLSFLTKFTLSGYFLGVAICLIIYQFKKDKSEVLSCTLCTLISFIVIFLLTCVYFVINQNVSDFIDSYFVFNLFSYAVPNTFVTKILVMIKALAFYSKNNIILVPLSLFSIVCSIMHFKKSNISLFILSTFICWYFITFIGGKTIAYYILPIAIYLVFGILILEKYSFSKPIMCIICLFSIITSHNIKDITKKDYVQYEFSNIIGDSSFLVFEGYDQGFYMINDTTPGCKYFTTTNGWLPNYKDDTLNCINSNTIDYLISIDNKLDLDNYVLIKEIVQEYESKDRVYRLYKRRENK